MMECSMFTDKDYKTIMSLSFFKQLRCDSLLKGYVVSLLIKFDLLGKII